MRAPTAEIITPAMHTFTIRTGTSFSYIIGHVSQSKNKPQHKASIGEEAAAHLNKMVLPVERKGRSIVVLTIEKWQLIQTGLRGNTLGPRCRYQG